MDHLGIVLMRLGVTWRRGSTAWATAVWEMRVVVGLQAVEVEDMSIRLVGRGRASILSL